MLELYAEASRDLEKFVLYGGQLDVEAMDIIPPEKTDPRNVQPKKTLTYLMKSYRKAVPLKEVCRMCNHSDIEKNSESEEIVERVEKIAEIIIEQGNAFIDRNLGKLPEDLEITVRAIKRKPSFLEKLGLKKDSK